MYADGKTRLKTNALKKLQFLIAPAALLSLFLSGCFAVDLLTPPRPLPFEFDKTDKIEIYSDESYANKEPLLTITEAEDIGKVTDIMKTVKGGYHDNPACAFGVWMVCYAGDKSINLEIGTDDCGTVLYNELDYSMSEDNFRQLRSLLIDMGVDVRDYVS